MKRFIDTSILLPALLSSHPDHRMNRHFLDRILSDNQTVCCLGLHTQAELYANITRFPKGKRVHPLVALKMVEQVSAVMQVIELDQTDYHLALKRCADLDLISGVVYDALHLQAAIKANAEVLYTNNLKDFQRLLLDDVKVDVRSIRV